MTPHTLTVLEFSTLLQQIADNAQSGPGAARILDIRPMTELEAIRSRRGLYHDMMQLRETALDVPSLHAEDLGEILRMAAPEGAIIGGEELLACRSQLDVAAEVAAFLQQKGCEVYENLQKAAAPLNPCLELRDAIRRSIDVDGSVLDSASEKLRMLRRQAVSLEQRIQRSLEGMLKDSSQAPFLQDHFVTVRNGRYVIPVKTEAHTALPGIVHDLSNSGQTLFVEPSTTLPLGNELVQLRAEEREEVRRILAALSGQVRARIGQFQVNQQILARLDAANAVARWAVLNRCVLPAFGNEFILRQARHPLLEAQFRKTGSQRQIVPLDMELPRRTKVLAITGSNTGGKTVALKTIGLVALAAQSGLPVPVSPDSLFTVFDDIFADIGDEQSIEANLSTFSAHLSNIADILNGVRQGRCLVLLDELGSGTDPLEGGAIACGILHELATTHALTITTTHLGMVKNYVHEQEGMVNAAVRFNVDTLMPEYVLEIGRPGASHALHIARRLGLPASVLQSAESMLSKDQLRLEDMLSRMEKDQRRISTHAEKLKQTQEDMEQKRDSLKEELDKLRKERKRLMAEASQQATAMVENTRREMENLIRGLRENAKRTENAELPDTSAIRKAIDDKVQRLQESRRRSETMRGIKPMGADELQPGKKVWVEKISAHGHIEGFFDGGAKVAVNVNGVVFTMKTKDLQRAQEPDKPEDHAPKAVKFVLPRVTGATSHELNLIGLRVEEALPRLENFLNQAIMARIDEVRIVHGFGTGRLRNGIHEWLRKAHGVKGFRLGKDMTDPGGGGCTIVQLDL